MIIHKKYLTPEIKSWITKFEPGLEFKYIVLNGGLYPKNCWIKVVKKPFFIEENGGGFLIEDELEQSWYIYAFDNNSKIKIIFKEESK